MEIPKPLAPEQLCRGCDPNQFPFQSTAELEELSEVIGQPRAVEAVRFGIGIRREGYNLYCLGPAGVGKHFIVRQFLEQQAARDPVPSDWCYINNFEQPQKPLALRLPPGQGIVFRRDMEQLVEALRSAIPAAFESEEYRTRKQVIETELKERHEKAFEEVRRKGAQKGIGMLRTPTGLVFAPLRNGEVLDAEEFERLPEAERLRLEAEVEALQRELQAAMRDVPRWEMEGREKIKALNREVTNFAVGHLIGALREKYTDLPEVINHLNAIEQDVIENVDEFLKPPESPLAALMGLPQRHVPKGSPFFRRYEVNLLVDHSGNHGAPVVYEDNPTFQNLNGLVEYTAQFGALVTDFNLIRPGALHRANGGYLLLDARKLLSQPYAWEGLKRALQSGEIRIESLGEMLGIVNTVSLQPQRIPLQVKVVLIGERLLYYLLCQYDPEFSELFKVAADFEERIDRTPETSLLYARLIGTLAKRQQLLPFDRTAVARVMEQSARLAGDSEKLSAHSRALVDLLQEADYWARANGRSVVAGADVSRAIEAQIRRSDRVRERLQEEILRGTLRIDTEQEKIGQVNGLSVVQLGQFSFGHPSRITARVRLGRGEVVDIEREVELGGPIHSKGVLILSSFLGARYAPDRPLSLSASLVFEQSYGGVEGDSASSAELYALLSALAEVPIRQWLAVTGSVDQQGHVQAIGGVNEKIEGFFDVCKARGLSGRQGVLIPAANVKHLMLRHDVVQAVAEGKFHVYAIETIDQGMEILTGLPAGERDASGKFPEGSLNQRVEARCIELAEKRRQFGQAEQPKANA
ncbi:MAG TPA: ATP-binding protein [Terriglobia bacterium]|nr:ATP-binding protein [Terriglobia bacterium]